MRTHQARAEALRRTTSTGPGQAGAPRAPPRPARAPTASRSPGAAATPPAASATPAARPPGVASPRTSAAVSFAACAKQPSGPDNSARTASRTPPTARTMRTAYCSPHRRRRCTTVLTATAERGLRPAHHRRRQELDSSGALSAEKADQGDESPVTVTITACWPMIVLLCEFLAHLAQMRGRGVLWRHSGMPEWPISLASGSLAARTSIVRACPRLMCALVRNAARSIFPGPAQVVAAPPRPLLRITGHSPTPRAWT